jgi:hypothetical protein
MRYLVIAAALAVLAALTPGPAGRQAQAAGKAQGWGTVKGVIVFDGTPPVMGKVDTQGNNDPKKCKKVADIYKENWVVNPKNKGVQWTFVWLAPDPANGNKTLPIHPDLKKVPKEPAVMDQPCCQFIPHCLGIREGQTWLVKNSAPFSHNVRYVGHPLYNKGESVIIPAGKSHEVKGLKAQPLPLTVNCDLHKWMNARIAVFNHPYFAVTKADGSFEIKKAPAGKYRLFVWHESVGYRGGEKGADGEPITIKASGVTNLGNLKIKPEDD